jgi:hypothetical protein
VSTQGTSLQAGLVRPFVLTGGRTTSTRPGLRWESLVEAAPEQAPGTLTSEQQAVLALSSKPVSVAELSAALHLPTQVVAIIVGDLLDAGAVRVHQTDPVEIELSALTRMIERVRNL